MKISELKIQGFRKHENTEIKFSDSTFLIGENNAGKSTILHALDYLLTPKKKAEESDFFKIESNGKVLHREDKIVLEAKFLVSDHEADNWRGFRGRLILSDDDKRYFSYKKEFTIDGKTNVYAKESLKKSSKFDGCHTVQDYVELGIGIDEFPEEIKSKGNNYRIKTQDENLLKDVLEIYEETEDFVWVQNPGGIEQNVLSRLPKFILIPADDKKDELSQNGVLNKILNEVFDTIKTDSENYAKVKEYLKKLLDELNPENPESKTKTLMGELQTVVAEIFPDTTLNIDSNLTDANDAVKPKFTINMCSNVTTRPELQGTGMIRSAVFALLRFKARRDVEHGESTNCQPLLIGFEEPELYLHPNAVGKMCDVIYELAQTNNNQIVCTTHSPYMIDITRKPKQVLNRLYVNEEKTDDKKKISVKVKSFNITEPFITLQNDDKTYVKMLARMEDTIAKAFFTKYVLIVEGDTEYIALNETFRFISKEDKSRVLSDWYILRAHGKPIIISIVKYLQAMGIDPYVMHDADIGVDGAERFNSPISEVVTTNKLHILHNCVENVIGCKEVKSDKPLNAYKYFTKKTKSSELSFNWIDLIETIFGVKTWI